MAPTLPRLLLPARSGTSPRALLQHCPRPGLGRVRSAAPVHTSALRHVVGIQKEHLGFGGQAHHEWWCLCCYFDREGSRNEKEKEHTSNLDVEENEEAKRAAQGAPQRTARARQRLQQKQAAKVKVPKKPLLSMFRYSLRMSTRNDLP
ncbi:uncharacterized protein LOC119276948 isoform X1 [Triticum dicoccoides]|uniref:uncharacterized protein LOC119276948 isoform X1 n=1 Tax=Triticum dicoccoides TaxID=85692 RepID=UPI000E7AF966|nr:uncharacterized protein LOC119276948 isoform X1 [Triticum dicoccoides]XP_037414027.1 uncharacterized protein LOC119276948 isoform X1 [Triticum dicoccoides]XP_037414028.1 uncharacterized protein LOC119276948 isoform X1 [Triticum dicoccoides]